MSQQRLFTLAPVCFSAHATFVDGEGWHLQVAVRRQGESWGDAPWVHYDHLTTVELADILCIESARSLGAI